MATPETESLVATPAPELDRFTVCGVMLGLRRRDRRVGVGSEDPHTHTPLQAPPRAKLLHSQYSRACQSKWAPPTHMGLPRMPPSCREGGPQEGFALGPPKPCCRQRPGRPGRGDTAAAAPAPPVESAAPRRAEWTPRERGAGRPWARVGRPRAGQIWRFVINLQITKLAQMRSDRFDMAGRGPGRRNGDPSARTHPEEPCSRQTGPQQLPGGRRWPTNATSGGRPATAFSRCAPSRWCRGARPAAPAGRRQPAAAAARRTVGQSRAGPSVLERLTARTRCVGGRGRLLRNASARCARARAAVCICLHGLLRVYARPPSGPALARSRARARAHLFVSGSPASCTALLDRTSRRAATSRTHAAPARPIRMCPLRSRRRGAAPAAAEVAAIAAGQCTASGRGSGARDSAASAVAAHRRRRWRPSRGTKQTAGEFQQLLASV